MTARQLINRLAENFQLCYSLFVNIVPFMKNKSAPLNTEGMPL
jgi:hypothetical protein